MQLPTVELQANDGKHEDGKEEQEADLQKRHHGLHDGLQHNLQAWGRDENSRWSLTRRHLTEQAVSLSQEEKGQSWRLEPLVLR